MAQEFYVRTSDEVLGPLTPKQLALMARSGELTPQMSVSLDNKKWIRASNVKGLSFADGDEPATRENQDEESGPSTTERIQGAVGGLWNKLSKSRTGTSTEDQGDHTSNESATRQSPYSKFMNEDQDSRLVEQIVPKITQILMTGEELLYIAIQKKPIVTLTPEYVILTDKRFIVTVHGLARLFGSC